MQDRFEWMRETAVPPPPSRLRNALYGLIGFSVGTALVVTAAALWVPPVLDSVPQVVSIY